MAYQEGDPGHLSVHNALRAEIADAATEMGVEVVLPDEAVAGQTGHVDAHNLITDALAKIAAEGSAGASWAQVISAPDAVTSSYYDDKGGQWQYYEWNAPGTFEVELSGGLVWCLTVGGGSGGNNSSDAKIQQGQPGLVTEGLWEFGPGTHTVTVGAMGATNKDFPQGGAGRPSSIGDYGTQGVVMWGACGTGRGAVDDIDKNDGYKSSITGDELEYAPGYQGPEQPGRGGYNGGEQRDGCVIIAVRIDVPTLPPAPPRLEVAPVVAKPVSISGPEVQEWLVRDKQGNRKVVYFLPGNTGTARSLGLTDEGVSALEARRDLLDAIATTDVPEDFDGDPVTLLPKKLRAELRGFVEVRATSQPEAVYSVTLGAGVLPGVMVGAGGAGGCAQNANMSTGGGGAGGVIGQGAHVPVILPVQGTATYTIKVGSTTTNSAHPHHAMDSQSTTIEVQGQTPFTAAMGGGQGTSVVNNYAIQAGKGGSGGGAGSWGGGTDTGLPFESGALGLPGQGNQGGVGTVGGTSNSGGGGGYGSRPNGGNGGDPFDLATALNLDGNDGTTAQFLNLVSVDGFIAGGGIARGGTTSMGGAGSTGGGSAKDYTGSGGAWNGTGATGAGGTGGAGAVYLITDPT